ncbi:MAG TPA: hypothetical protein VFR34_03325 [Paracoccaceae bacterium]|nr:hypothetical protein [Paracoccaceae bacterium]
MGDDVLGGEALARLRHDDGVHGLAPMEMRDADDGALGDGGMQADGVLDLDGTDVFAARDDHVLDAVLDEDIADLVEAAGIAGRHPAAAQGRGRRGGLAPIALHHHRPAHGDLADLARRELAVAGIDDLDLGAKDGAAARPLGRPVVPPV